MLINEKEYNRIVAMNLKRILFESGKTQTDLSNDLNIPKSTISGWMNGKRTPKMDKIDMLCKKFSIENQLPFTLSISLGAVDLQKSSVLKKLLSEADKELYKEKKKKHARQ